MSLLNSLLHKEKKQNMYKKKYVEITKDNYCEYTNFQRLSSLAFFIQTKRSCIKISLHRHIICYMLSLSGCRFCRNGKYKLMFRKYSKIN